MIEKKFRAWVTEKEEMMMEGTIDTWFEAVKHTSINPLRSRPQTVMLQYRGYKDRNGKEIYEGDILKILHGEWMSKPESDNRTLDEYLDSLTKKYEVVFIEGQFVGRRKTGSYTPWSTDNEGNTYAKLKPEKHGFIEIIGNIYESSHLLDNTDTKA
jgi:uncharacterized phage protein (TIGR01671 family)